MKKCPVDGQWGKWGEWSNCPVSCGGGEQIRVRSCNNPKPSGGGKDCDGEEEATRKCATFECGPDWKAEGCYKNSVRALSEILKVNARTISSRFAACMSEADGKGITLFGMDDKRCWIGEDADSSYDRYGTSGLCKKTKKGINYGLSEHDAMRVYMKDVEGIWQDKGCYVNKAASLALPDPFDTSVDTLQGNENIFEHCSEKAKFFGYTVFGVDDKKCWAGDNAENTYKKYGKSAKCTVGKTGYGSGKGINGDMFVYRYYE